LSGFGRRSRSGAHSKPFLKLLELGFGRVIHGLVFHLHNLSLKRGAKHFGSGRGFALGFANTLFGRAKSLNLIFKSEPFERL
jgi:hypothetical protein